MAITLVPQPPPLGSRRGRSGPVLGGSLSQGHVGGDGMPEPTSEVGGRSAAGLRGAGVSGQRLRCPWDRPAATSRSTSVSPQWRPRPLLTGQGRAGQHWHCLSLQPPPAWHSALPSGPHSLQPGRGSPESTRTPGGPRPAAVGQLQWASCWPAGLQDQCLSPERGSAAHQLSTPAWAAAKGKGQGGRLGDSALRPRALRVLLPGTKWSEHLSLEARGLAMGSHPLCDPPMPGG